jgi:hypothetical protein
MSNTTTLCYTTNQFARLWTCEIGLTNKIANQRKNELEHNFLIESFTWNKNDKLSTHLYWVKSDLSEKCMENMINNQSKIDRYELRNKCDIDIKVTKYN